MLSLLMYFIALSVLDFPIFQLNILKLLKQTEKLKQFSLMLLSIY